MILRRFKQDGALTPPSLTPPHYYPYYRYSVGRTFIGKYRTALTEPFFAALVEGSGISLSLRKLRGDNGHHIIESAFKSFARALRIVLDRMTAYAMDDSERLGLAMARAGSRERRTNETSMEVAVALDGRGAATVDSGIGFLDKILTEIAIASGISLDVKVSGDLYIDDHHTAEDSMIALGQALDSALGTRGGCCRMCSATAEIDGNKVTAVMDLSNRPILIVGHAPFPYHRNPDSNPDAPVEPNALWAKCFTNRAPVPPNLLRQNDLQEHFDDGVELCDDLAAEMVDHVFLSITMNAQSTVHLVWEAGGSTRSLVIAAAQAYGAALKTCTAIDPRRAGLAASSKGTLSV